MRAWAAGVALALLGCAHAEVPGARPRVVGRVRALDGAAVDLGSLHGRPALVLMFATWSAPSLLEVQRVATVVEPYRDRLEVVGIALDDQVEAVRVFVGTFAPPFRVLMPEDRAAFVGASGPFGALAVVPTTVLVRASGAPLGAVEGAWPDGALAAAIDRLLAEDRVNR